MAPSGGVSLVRCEQDGSERIAASSAAHFL
jgi:hypothetical protein